MHKVIRLYNFNKVRELDLVVDFNDTLIEDQLFLIDSLHDRLCIHSYHRDQMNYTIITASLLRLHVRILFMTSLPFAI